LLLAYWVNGMRDIVFLVADGEMEATVVGFFENPAYEHRLGCRRFEFDSKQDLAKHPRKDPGVYQDGHIYLKGYLATHQFAVVMLDAQFGGAPAPAEIKAQIQNNMILAGWPEDCFIVMVINPELEVLMWQQDTQGIEHIIDYPGQQGSLRQWLDVRHLWPEDAPKPPDPKAAIDLIRSQSWGRKKTHSQIYKRVAKDVSFKSCQDQAFLDLWRQLQNWYPVEWA
jgi:hypothetical protein